MVPIAVFDGQDDPVGGQEARELLAPFDQHEGVGFKDLFEAEREEFARLFEAIEIDVIDARGFAVLVDEREGRAGDFGRRSDAEGFDESRDQGRLAGAEVARELDYGAAGEQGGEFGGGGAGLFDVGGGPGIARHSGEWPPAGSAAGRWR
jgi:hypothetical protein